MKKVLTIIISVLFIFCGCSINANYNHSEMNDIPSENTIIASGSVNNELIESDSYSEMDTNVTAYDDINESIKNDVNTLKQIVINNEELFNAVGEIVVKRSKCNVFLNENSEWDFGTLDLTAEEKQTVIEALNILQSKGFNCVLENYRTQLNACFVTHINYSDNWIEMGIIYKDKTTSDLVVGNFADLVIGNLYVYSLSSI